MSLLILVHFLLANCSNSASNVRFYARLFCSFRSVFVTGFLLYFEYQLLFQYIVFNADTEICINFIISM